MNSRTATVIPMITVFILCGSLQTRSFSLPEMTNKKSDRKEEKTEYIVYGEKTTVSTKNRWISNNPDEVDWIVEVPGGPEEIYVIDQEAQEEISHMETINHPAVTHQEAIYGSRVVWTVSYYSPENDYTELLITKLYDMTEDEVLAYFEERDCDTTDMQQSTEQYITGYRTVTDQDAWSEEIKVIDQEELEEIGHYETIIVGEIGYFVNKRDIAPTEGDGRFEAMVRKTTETYEKVEE